MRKRILSLLISICLITSIMVVPALASATASDLIDFARKQVGKTGPDLGLGSSEWCGTFVWWCANQVGFVDGTVFPGKSTMQSVTSTSTWYAKIGAFTAFSDSGQAQKIAGANITKRSTSGMQIGDLVMFEYKENNQFSHMGIITAITENGINLVHGNWGMPGGAIVQNTKGCGIGDKEYIGSSKPARIAGYAHPNYGASAGTTTPATSTLSINPTNFPSGALTPGGKFYCRGSITSNYKITSATATILTSSGTSVQTKTVYPNKTNVDVLADGLDSLKFASLSVGSYIYKMSAQDSSGASKEWSGAFSVGEAAKVSTLSINLTSFPSGALTLGAKVYCRGSITSNYTVTSASSSILTLDGTVVQTKTVSPNKTSVDVLADGLDSLKFASLSAGSYIYKMSAQDSSGASKEWSGAFTVGEAAKKTHFVYFNANGGAVGTSQITVTENAAYGTLPEPVFQGYTFDGWYTSAVGGTQISSATVFSSTSDQTLYAHWTKQDLSSFENFSYSKNWTGSQFSDIPTGEWYYSNVKTAYQLGLMNGVGSGAFSPKANVTIAQAITLAARLHNIYYNGMDSFTTYDGGNWYDTYVDYSEENGIISGNYDMNATATRGQFAQILAGAFQDDKALAAIRNVEFANIPDVSGNESYATAVLRLYRAGVLTGSDSKGTFNAGSTISRAEVATIVTRMAVLGLRIGS